MKAEPNPHPGSLFWRPLDDGFEIVVWPMTYGKARLCYGEQGALEYIDGYCYADPAVAIAAALVWTGEGDPPDGWHRHPSSGRRRENGDPATEHVRW